MSIAKSDFLYRFAALCLLASFAYRLYPKEPRFDCHPSAQLMMDAMRGNQGLLATAITDKAEVIQIFLNKETWEWTQIAVDGDLRGCVMKRGTDWQFALEWS